MMNLLIVDDEFFVAEGIANTLRYENLEIDEVFSAYSAQMAQEIMEKEEISILITDVEMPGPSGMDLLRWVKEKNFNIKTILLTGHKKFEYAYEAVELGVLSYLVKPVNKEKLKSILTEAIEAYQKQQALEKWWKNLPVEEIEALQKRETQNDTVALVKRLIRENIDQPELGRAFLAKQVFLNEDYLSCLFHEKSGETLKACISRERIRRVKELLVMTDYTQEEIAEKTGFCDVVYMRKVFKKQEGVTPNQYRENKSS